jgi:alpha-N-arabinofuranosidase
LGRETFLAPVTWSEDGWPKVGTDGIVKQEYTAPKLPQHVWEKEPTRDDFESTSLRLPWNFLRNPHTEDWSLSERPGFLRLKGSKVSLKEKDSPAYICRRQTAFDVTVSTKIDFTPTASNEEAGLLIRGNDTNHYDFLITMSEGKRVVMFREYLQDNVVKTEFKDIPDGDVILKIEATESEYRFVVQPEGEESEAVATALTRNLSTEVIHGFTGVFIGMYASGNGEKNQNPADFDWFDYKEGL